MTLSNHDRFVIWKLMDKTLRAMREELIHQQKRAEAAENGSYYRDHSSIPLGEFEASDLDVFAGFMGQLEDGGDV